MSEINQEEMQQELFVEFAGAAKKSERFLPQSKVNKAILLNTSVEQIILVSIALILICCFVFFLGVLRGKSLGIYQPQALAQKKVSSLQVAPVKPVQTSEVSYSSATDASRFDVRPAPHPSKIQGSLVPGKPYTVQVSTYKKQDLAEKEAVTLRRSGYYSAVVPSSGYFTVCVGQYATRDEAKKDLKALGSKFKGCFLRGSAKG